MAKKKYYAVRKGKATGIFESWDECKNSVEGYSGAQYKGFATKEDAEVYLEIKLQPREIVKKHEDIIKDKSNDGLNEGTIIAYVDGSYNKDKNIYGSGVLLLSKNIEKEISKTGNDEIMLEMWNVAGEVCAAMIAIEEAIKLGFKKIIIYHDYTGIAGWVNGYSSDGKPSKIWKAKEKGSAVYKQFASKAKEIINIEFVKVKAHSDNEFNSRVDKLAKEACGIK